MLRKCCDLSGSGPFIYSAHFPPSSSFLSLPFSSPILTGRKTFIKISEYFVKTFINNAKAFTTTSINSSEAFIITFTNFSEALAITSPTSPRLFRSLLSTSQRFCDHFHSCTSNNSSSHLYSPYPFTFYFYLPSLTYLFRQQCLKLTWVKSAWAPSR